MNKTRRNQGLLVLTSFLWGISFVSQRTGGDVLGGYTFNCVRSFIGSFVLIFAIALLDKLKLTERKPTTKEEKKTLLTGGIACGIILCIATNLQQMGIVLGTSAGKAGFLTACYIVLVPILGIFLKKKCGLNVWVSVGITVIGLYLLCMKESLSIQTSDFLVIICAFVFSCHILVVDHFSPLVDGVRMSCIQFLTCGVITAFPMFLVDMKHSFHNLDAWIAGFYTWDAWIALLYAGIFSCGVAYTLQIIGQQGVNPTVASLLMSLESVFSVLAGFVLLHERMSIREVFGCIMIFIAVVLAQLPQKNDIITKKGA